MFTLSAQAVQATMLRRETELEHSSFELIFYVSLPNHSKNIIV